jgi:membrane protein YdbS with pleckstrin-like domain
MAKTTKQEPNSKPGKRIRFFSVLLVLLGADLILLFAPGVGILNSIFYIGEAITWSAVAAGLVLLVFGFRNLYTKRRS